MVVVIDFVWKILHTIKDVLVIPIYGVEVIPTIKSIGVPFVTFLVFLLYTRLVTLFNRITVYYICVIGFMLWFLLYAFYIDPMYLNITYKFADDSYFKQILYFKYNIIFLIENWPLVLFYASCELWGVILMMLFFWQILYQITTFKDAKVEFPMYLIFAQIGVILASGTNFIIGEYFNKHSLFVLKWIAIIILFAGIFLCACMKKLQQLYSSDSINGLLVYDFDNRLLKKNKTIELNFFQSLKYIFSSKYIFYIVLLIFCFSIASNLSELMWKKQILRYTNNSQQFYLLYQSKIDFLTGIFTGVFSLISFFILKKIKWKYAVSIPIISVGIIGSVILMPYFLYCAFIVHIGALIRILGRSSTYAFLDPSKELCFISLSENEKSVGKAVVECIGTRFGKSVGNWIQVTLIFMYPTYTLFDFSKFILIIFLFFIFLCLFAILSLERKLFHR